MTTREQAVARRDQLFDYLADHGDGATLLQIRADLKLTEGQMARTLRDLRLWCGEYDEINVVCDPDEAQKPWLYKLVGNLDAARDWRNFQMKNLETRLETSLAIAKSMVAAYPDGRLKDAKKAKKIARVLGRLIEDLEEIREEV